MTPKEKAEVIFEKMLYAHGSESWYERAKECALVAVDEIMESNADFAFSLNLWGDNQSYVDCENYWNEVKTEIQKL